MVKNEIKILESNLKEILKEKSNELSFELDDFIFSESKRIRPRLIFLILKMLGLEVSPAHHKLALSVELLHSATLLHDDVIDCAENRRKKKALCAKFGDKLATLAGDYLLSLSFKALSEINNPDIIKIFSGNMIYMCNSEIAQYFTKNKIPEFSDYIEKSINKTSLLFLSAVKSALLISKYDKHLKEIEDFTLNFGLAFQILNDINSKQDIKNGIYTLPYIYFATENPNCDIINTDKKYFDMAKNFVYETIKKANKNLDFIDNEYKKALCGLINNEGS